MHPIKKLNELHATAICGNDITSSCLYVSALTIVYAGQYAWLALTIVAGVLYLFRKIYGEVVGALPLNGGAYNVLLNTTSKSNASVAACLTILSYMATAVLSASEAMHYLHTLLPTLSVFLATIGLLSFFLFLTILGISESSVVATIIFIFHLSSMVFLLGSGVWFVFTHGWQIAVWNFQIPVEGNFMSAIYFGFCAAMLGISGFESSANFVEEQAPGVFRKTLRNMWISVAVINPLMALLAILVVSKAEVVSHQEALLSHIGFTTGGTWLRTLISIDAVLVLSGAVLTSYVGVGGLIKRMALDRILPQFTLKENRRGSAYRILILFFLLCLSVLFVTQGQLAALAGVYTISFLSVMIYFGIGNFLLKMKRDSLPRPVYASPITVVVAVGAVTVALYGNIKLHPEYLLVFLQYFVPAILIIMLMLNRVELFRMALVVIDSFFSTLSAIARILRIKLTFHMHRLNNQQFVYFSKADSIASLNKVMMYVHENEPTNRLKIVTVLKEGQDMPKTFLSDLDVLDRAYPEIDIEFVQLTGSFTPELVRSLSKNWNIPINFMFIASPGNRFPYKVAELGGVRLII
ncbi:APC family permease [Chryseolinea lacunae]|uniref:APC family permease n=1 Tax=Chryseolinea lacunae TaxID=2801331 RepID=A0ABS1KZS8_9BACT|nr:APC family permease [Chryseolinea lacunae]MBL0744172.1 APC family permease [Chryseolinea lacunae]